MRLSILSVICLGLTLSACATRPKQYSAPDAAKMNASSQRLARAVTKARATAEEARQKVGESQASANRVTVLSGTTKGQVDTLYEVVPQPFKDQVLALRANVESQQAEEGVLVMRLGEATATHERLKADLNEAEAAKLQLQSDQARYVADAGELANKATDERNARMKAEKSLSWYRWHFWLSWIVAGAGVVVCIILAILKFTGRLAISGAKFGL